jgi:hypothetical protein
MDITKLAEYFAPSDIEWRIQQAGWKDGKPWAMVLAYLTSRAVQQRLDDVCGPFGWQNSFHEGKDAGITCGIAIKNPETGEWVTKYDAADATDIEAIKGGRSGAMKRAAVHWGIGRYLYNLDVTFANCITEYPPQQEKQLWNKHYDSKEKKAFFWKTPDLPKWALPKLENKA